MSDTQNQTMRVQNQTMRGQNQTMSVQNQTVLAKMRSFTITRVQEWIDRDSASIVASFLFVACEWPASCMTDLTLGLIDQKLNNEQELQSNETDTLRSHIVHLDRGHCVIGSHTIEGAPTLGYFPYNVESVFYMEYVDLNRNRPQHNTGEFWLMFVQLKPILGNTYFCVIEADGAYGAGWYGFSIKCFISISFDTTLQQFFVCYSHSIAERCCYSKSLDNHDTCSFLN
jgi:hypothetical protein